MKTQRTIAALAAATVAFGLVLEGLAPTGHAADNAKSGAAPSAEHSRQAPFLGILVGPISPALASHLHGAVPDGQGLVVREVVKNSPAAAGGLKVHDILVCYDDQKLFSPMQLVGLVRQGKAEQEISLSIIREGKPLTIKLKLGSRPLAHYQAENETPAPETGGFNAPPGSAMPGEQPPHRFAGSAAQSSGPQEWETFDSMTIEKQGNDRFHVLIQYLNKNGGLDRKTFDGSREEIHKSILAQKDLPAEERRQLFRSLDLPAAEFKTTGAPLESEFQQFWNEEFPQRPF